MYDFEENDGLIDSEFDDEGLSEDDYKRSRWYDSRMSVWDNFVYLYWKRFACYIAGHDFWCARIVPSEPVEYVWMCKNCAEMVDAVVPCGSCSNEW